MYKRNYKALYEELTTYTQKPEKWQECDNGDCSAKAMFKFEYDTGTLVFCGHHTRQHLPNMGTIKPKLIP